MSADLKWKGASLTTTLVSEKQSNYLFLWYQNIHSASVSFVTIHACDRRMDGQTDRITTPKTALAYARAVKTRMVGLLSSKQDKKTLNWMTDKANRKMYGHLMEKAQWREKWRVWYTEPAFGQIN